MKNKLTILIGALLILITACAAQKKTGKDSKGPAITSVKMRRTTCFGRCPDYSIEIQQGGMARYTGYRFTDMIGVYEKNIGADKAAELIQGFKTYRADTCQSEYRMLISDLPGLNYTINMEGKTKTIHNAHFGPEFLKSLGKRMDEEVKADKSWKQVSETPGEQE